MTPTAGAAVARDGFSSGATSSKGYFCSAVAGWAGAAVAGALKRFMKAEATEKNSRIAIPTNYMGDREVPKAKMSKR